MSWFLISKTDLVSGESASAYRWDQEGEVPIELPEEAVTELINCLLSRLSEEEADGSLDRQVLDPPVEVQEAASFSVEDAQEAVEQVELEEKQGKRTLRDLMRQANSNKGIEDEDGVSQG